MAGNITDLRENSGRHQLTSVKNCNVLLLANLFTPSTNSSTAIAFPKGGLTAWLVVFGSFYILLSTYGLTAAIGQY